MELAAANLEHHRLRTSRVDASRFFSLVFVNGVAGLLAAAISSASAARLRRSSASSQSMGPSLSITTSGSTAIGPM